MAVEVEAREQQTPRLSAEVDRLSNRLRAFEEREATLVAEAAAGAAALKEQARRADALEKEQRRMTAQHEEQMEEERTKTRLALERLRNELTGSLEEQQKMKRTEEMAQHRCSKRRLSVLSESIAPSATLDHLEFGARLRTLERRRRCSTFSIVSTGRRSARRSGWATRGCCAAGARGTASGRRVTDRGACWRQRNWLEIVLPTPERALSGLKARMDSKARLRSSQRWPQPLSRGQCRRLESG